MVGGLEREIPLPIDDSPVTRNYFYSQRASRAAFALTVMVSQGGARAVAESLLLKMVYTQMHSEPRADFSKPPFGDVTIYRHPDRGQSVAFVRDNVAISIENYSAGRRRPDLNAVAADIDQRLRGAKTSATLANHPNVPKIARFEPRSIILKPGERTDLDIEVNYEHPPLEYVFRVKGGSCNADPVQAYHWYFRAGPETGSAHLTLIVVNDINLMTQSRTTIAIS